MSKIKVMSVTVEIESKDFKFTENQNNGLSVEYCVEDDFKLISDNGKYGYVQDIVKNTFDSVKNYNPKHSWLTGRVFPNIKPVIKTPPVEVEIENTDEYFKFRLRQGDQVSSWANYLQIVYLNGYCAATEYYLLEDKALKAITPDEMLQSISVR